MPNDIPILVQSDNISNDPQWNHFYGGSLQHPDYNHPVFYRSNGSNINLFNMYSGETVYLIGRGPSIRNIVENKNTRKLLCSNCLVKYGMNTSPEILENNVNIYSCCDKPKGFSPSIFKNPNILKLIPMNRFQRFVTDLRSNNTERNISLKDNGLVPFCPNTVGVQTLLLENHVKNKMKFSDTFLGTTAVLFGYHKGQKSTFLFSLKLCVLLGFKRIVFVGIDFIMNDKEPYYNNTLSDYSKYHVKHNNNLYTTLSPLVKDIYNNLKNGDSGYKVDIVTANPIDSMPFIETINIQEEMEKEIESKS